MTTISHNLTGKIDERTVALLSEIDTIARDLKLPFFIVGATARDILLQHAHDINPTRATLDIDKGCCRHVYHHQKLHRRRQHESFL